MSPVLQIPIQPQINYDFVISFLPSISFNRIKIVTRFATVNSCFAQKGLRVINMNTMITCKSTSNIIEVYNFRTFVKSGRTNNDQVQIGLNAKTIILSGKSLPIEIYTYLDDIYQVKTQLSTTSIDTVVTITQAPPLQVSNVFQLSASSLDTYVTLSGDMVPLNGYAANANAVIRFVFPQLFQIGRSVLEGPVCDIVSYYQYELLLNIFSQTNVGTVVCNLNPTSPSILEYQLKSLSTTFPLLIIDPLKPYLAVKNSISITNIKTPKLAGNYDIDMYIHLANSEIMLEYYRLSVTIVPSAFTFTPTISNKNFGDNSLFSLQFTSPIDLNASNQSIDNYYEVFSIIVIKFQQVTGVQPAWSMDLGYPYSTSYQNIDCWTGLLLKSFSSGLKCSLILGRDPSLYTLSTSDYTSVIVQNYKTVSMGDTIAFSFFVEYPKIAVVPSVVVEIYEMNKGEKLLLMSATKTMPTPVAQPGVIPALTGLTFLSENMLADDFANVEFKFSTAVAYLPATLISLNINLPVAWIFSNSLGNQSEMIVDGVQYFYPNVVFNRYHDQLTVYLTQGLAIGSHTIRINQLRVPSGSSSANLVTLSLYTLQTVISRSQVDLGPISCIVITNVSMATDIKKSFAIGATYSFNWSNGKVYKNPVLDFVLPSSTYTFNSATVYSHVVSINGVELDSEKYTIDFFLFSFRVTLIEVR
jgi:hypothetical protein